MATISKPNTFSTGATIIASEHNDNFDTVYNDYNGNITNANIAAGASIADTKLATISTAGKVNVTALTSSGQDTGDILYYNGSAWIQLVRGSDNDILVATSTSINWQTTLTTIDIDGGAIDGAIIGANSAAAITGTVVEAGTSLAITGTGDDAVVATGIKDEDDMSSDSATHLATQQSIKAYFDAGFTGQVLQVVEGSNSTYSAPTDTIPLDDTIPAAGEGTVITSVAITPSNSNNLLVVMAEFHGAVGGNADLIAFISKDSDAAVQVGSVTASSGNRKSLNLLYKTTAGGTSAQTWKLNAGASSGTIYVNGQAGGARYFGGAQACRIVVMEVRA